jgi:hypothetical protein
VIVPVVVGGVGVGARSARSLFFLFRARVSTASTKPNPLLHRLHLSLFSTHTTKRLFEQRQRNEKRTE